MKYRSADTIRSEHLGTRVTVRRALPEGGASDVIGILEHVDDATLTVRDKRGERHTIGRGEIVAARVIGPLPTVENPESPASGENSTS